MNPRSLKYLACSQWRRLPYACHPSTRVTLAKAPWLGQGVRIGRRTSLVSHSSGWLVLDDGAWVGDDCEIEALGTVRIGHNTSVQHRSQLHGEVDIGAGCICAANLYISSTAHRFRDTPYMPIRWQDACVTEGARDTFSRPVVVEEDCWIGTNVVICPGVNVGRGSVVGANAVVTTDVPAYSVVAGVPAKVVGKRLKFDPPVQILADRPEDTPYFYSGFLMPIKERDWPQSAATVGRLVRSRFALALRVKDFDLLQIDLSVKSPVRLRHDDQEVSLPVGAKTIRIKAVPNAIGLIWFDVIDWAPGCLAVRAASLLESVGKQSKEQA